MCAENWWRGNKSQPSDEGTVGYIGLTLCLFSKTQALDQLMGEWKMLG